MTITVTITIIILCILAEAFFSGSEIAMVSVDKYKLRHSAAQGHKGSKMVLKMLEKPEHFLGTTLFGTNISVITNTTLSTTLFYQLLGPVGIPVAILVMSIINWIFSEIVPKSIFQQLSDSITLIIIYPLRIFTFLFFPFVWVFSNIATLFANIIGGKHGEKKESFVSKEELKILMKMKNMRGDIEPNEKKMINKILHFTETEAQDIMIPLIHVSLMSDKITIDQAISEFVKTKHRRVPIYRDRVDKIIGILNNFDILDESGEETIKKYIRPAYFIPPTMSIATLLEQLQANGKNMAIVVDEYGGAEGILTIEDILEEVVGEIEDEYDNVSKPFQIQEDGSIVLSARMEIEAINEQFMLSLPEGDYDTIGGLVLNKLKRIPKPGEKIKISGREIIVRRATEKVIIDLVIPKNSK